MVKTQRRMKVCTLDLCHMGVIGAYSPMSVRSEGSWNGRCPSAGIKACSVSWSELFSTISGSRCLMLLHRPVGGVLLTLLNVSDNPGCCSCRWGMVGMGNTFACLECLRQLALWSRSQAVGDHGRIAAGVESLNFGPLSHGK